MSYFICGYKTISRDIKALYNLLLDVTPEDKQNDALQLEGLNSSLARYGTEKVIPDVVIKKENGDSWLAVVGTPLVSLKDKRHQQMLLDSFLASPRDFLRHKMDGNFALFCYDSERNRFIAASDFNNTTPIFCSVRSNGVFFSSHELVLAKFLNAEIDPIGFAQAIQLGNTWGAYTRFKNIFKILPCQMLIIDDNKQIRTERYWRPKDETVLSCGFDELVEHWLSSLGDSVRGFYESGGCKPIMSDLTGGEDTRLLVAQCHALGLPFKALVIGSNDNSDVIVARQASAKAGIDLIVRKQEWISEGELLDHVRSIVLGSDAYHAFVDSCVEFATNRTSPFDDNKIVKLCGVAPAEFRGSYYLKGKAIFPSGRSRLDYKFFARLKFLLDYYPGLLVYPDDLFLDSVYGMINEDLKEAEGFPLGTQIDHLLRVFDSCYLGMKYKVPLYLPYMTRDLTRSLYYIPAHYKQWGRLTRACTEILFPELAFVKTQKGVPTVRMTAMRLPLFIPEYINLIKSLSSKVVSRLFKWKDSKRQYLSMERNAYMFKAIISGEPYCSWFLSSKSMVTGQLYNATELNSFLAQAKTGSCKYVPILGRIINLELACRWVYRQGL
jgi:hypothetical protein